MITEVVYIVTPDYEYQLFNSLRSLILSGTSYDKISIICIGSPPTYWRFKNNRISVVQMPKLRDDYFLINKIYALKSDADRLIYLDTDTIILKSIDTVYQDKTNDFIGRPDSLLISKNNSSQKWEYILKKEQLGYVPYFNSGFYIFQNKAHKSLFQPWGEIVSKIFEDNFTAYHLHGIPPHPKEMSLHFCEQIALSITVGKFSLSYACMENHEHAFGWTNDPDCNATVYHTGRASYRHMHSRLQHKHHLFFKREPLLNTWPSPVQYKRWQGYARFRLSLLKKFLLKT